MTLTKKLILPVVVGYALLASALYLAWEPQQLDRSHAQYVEQQQLVLKTLHTLINDAVLQQDLDEVSLRLDQTWQTYETNWHYLALERQGQEPLYSAGTPSGYTTPYSTTIRERFLRDGYQIAALRADVDWSIMAKNSRQSMLHAEMLLLFVFMAVVVVLLVVTETFVKLPLLRLQRLFQITKGLVETGLNVG